MLLQTLFRFFHGTVDLVDTAVNTNLGSIDSAGNLANIVWLTRLSKCTECMSHKMGSHFAHPCPGKVGLCAPINEAR